MAQAVAQPKAGVFTVKFESRRQVRNLIRLADRWAGCIRLALKGNEVFLILLLQAKDKGLLREI